jgi:HEAT repeats
MRRIRTTIAAAAALTCVVALEAFSPRSQAVPPPRRQSAPASPQVAPAPAKPQPAAGRIQKLPPALRDRAKAALAETDEAKRGEAVEELIKANPVATLDFALALLEEDESPVVREEILDELEKETDPRVVPALERRLLSDPDPKIAIAALEVLRQRATLPLLNG